MVPEETAVLSKLSGDVQAAHILGHKYLSHLLKARRILKSNAE